MFSFEHPQFGCWRLRLSDRLGELLYTVRLVTIALALRFLHEAPLFCDVPHAIEIVLDQSVTAVQQPFLSHLFEGAAHRPLADWEMSPIDATSIG